MAGIFKHATDVAHRNANGLRTIRNNNTPTTKAAEECLDDLCRNGIVLCKQTRHGAVTWVWTSLEVD